MIPMIPGLSSALLLTTATVCALLALTVVARRVIRTRAQAKSDLRRDRVRPLILDILDGENCVAQNRQDRATLVLLVAETAGQVRGDDRSALTAWLTDQQFHRTCLKKMQSPFALTRARALSSFAPMAHLAPRSVEQMLSDRDQGVRSLAAQIAGRSGVSELIPALLRSVDGSRSIPARIVSMAVLRTAPSSIASFSDTPADGNYRVRALAIDLAGQLNLVDARQAIESGLRSENSDVRAASIRSIQRLGSPLSLPALEELRPENTTEFWTAQAVMRELLVG
ncbi:HEAT repeat domain-containing protein [Salinibacterium sp. M195]|uniref:HEAT repeat domain-containing protein n=1 Tax=Salinibacterium sp. M195 TaxID=2583374 RepID=UPI001C626C6A|nr:HEAT repeat domain-containing protein [Salinibacterium sp. M195]QYH34923.1 hypothetical protein FFT87_02580 [Salinibacterium sp. M195]